MTEEVHELEHYCETVWQISEDIRSGNLSGTGKIGKKLQKSIIKVSNRIKNRIPTTREVVFLPYKASMWDSLETLWKRASEDSDTIAVVVPIPYFDKNPDGSFRQVHYEGALFPKDVPVVSYQKYNIEERHPDAIYIHNPYDEANYVTSVHPDYYSSKLKEFTDELIYIPYFVLGDIDPSNESAVESYSNLIVVSAVINAHKVIVQSEAWKQAYVNVLSKEIGERSRPYWENKIIGSGSPKLERVRNLKKEDFQIPLEWNKLITRPDGSRKKIVFYNTGISALLKENEKMLDKIIRVFETFKANTEDVVLLWRPHPLIQATLTSMRYDLWEQYKRVLDEYKSAGWGIYDDSPELDRAIAISDAYYGDDSSVVWLYRETGKPIMIQNVEV